MGNILIKKECTICNEQKLEMFTTKCSNCTEVGITCNECNRKWESQGHDPNICTVCKQPSKQSSCTIFTDCKQRINQINLNEIIKWIFLLLFLSWLFSAVSYYWIFRLNPKKFITRPHISIGCGFVIAIPFAIIFRKCLYERCIKEHD